MEVWDENNCGSSGEHGKAAWRKARLYVDLSVVKIGKKDNHSQFCRHSDS